MQTHQRVSFADFILLHEGDDPVRLLLSRDKLRDLHPDLDIDLAVTTLEVRRKLKNKVPEWYLVPSLIYPFRLSGEQCSSSETAKYKASLLERFIGEGVLPETCGHPRPHKREGPAACGGRGRAATVSDSIPSLRNLAATKALYFAVSEELHCSPESRKG